MHRVPEEVHIAGYAFVRSEDLEANGEEKNSAPGGHKLSPLASVPFHILEVDSDKRMIQ